MGIFCGWKIKPVVGFVWNDPCEGCSRADKVQWDASQAPLDLATEHLGKCGQTDESRLGALPPKGRVTFSGDNMGLQWHRKHPLRPPPHCTHCSSFPSSLHPFPLFRPRPLSLSANFPGPECCSSCLLPFHSVTGQKIWQSSKSLVALYQGGRNGWKCDWLQQKEMITDRKHAQHQAHFLKILCAKL